MVSKFFYSNLLSNAPSTAIQSRPRLQRIIQYLFTVYSAKSPVILLAVSGTKMQDANRSRFNLDNASAAMNLGIDMISRGVIKPRDLLIITSYCAQFRLYWQSIQALARVKPRMMNIQVRTVDSMQGRQAEFVIFDLVASGNIGFMRLQNRVNVACSRAMDRMVILRDVDGILKEKIHCRRNLSDVFNYLKTRRLSKVAVKTLRNVHIPTSFARGGGSDTASA